MIASIVCLLATDFLYGLMLMQGTYDHQVWLDAGWIGVLSAVGRRRPASDDGARSTSRRCSPSGVLTRFRLALLAGASLIAPVIGIVDDLSDGDYDFAVVRARIDHACSASSSSRMAGLIRQQERSLERERMLSAAGARPRGRHQPRRDPRRRTLGRARNGGRRARHRAASVPGGRRAGPGGLRDAAERRPRSCACVPSSSPRLPCPSTTTACSSSTWRRSARTGCCSSWRGGRLRRSRCAPRSERSPRRSRSPSSALTLTEEVHRRRGEARFGSLVRHASDLITVHRPRRHDQLPEPVDRAAARVTTPTEWSGGASTSCSTPPTATASGELLADAAALAREEPRGAPVHPGARGRDAAPVRGELHQPAGRRARGRHRAQLPRHQRAQGVRGAAHAPGIPRPGHRAREPRALRRARAARHRAHARGSITASPSCSSTSTTSRRSTTASVMPPETRCSSRSAKRLATQHPRERHRRALRGRRVRAAARGHRGVQEAADTADRVLEALRCRCESPTRSSRCGAASASRWCRRAMAAGAEELIRDADAAMYRAKRDGKGSYRMFEPEMHEGVLARLELRTDLQRAIATEQLELYYQPVVRIYDGSITGVEALLRWRHPERGMISAGPVHPARRGNRPDHPDRPVGAARGLPPRTKDAGRPSPRRQI